MRPVPDLHFSPLAPDEAPPAHLDHVRRDGGDGRHRVAPVAGEGGRLLRGLLALAVLIFMGKAGLWLADPATLPVREVAIEAPLRQLTEAELQETLEGVVSGGFLRVDVDEIQRRLLANPWVARVTVQRAWPLKLLVTVVEQEAYARWGAEALLNPQGEIFRPRPATFPAGLPVLSGPEGTEDEVLRRYRLLRDELKQIDQRVAALDWDRRGGWSFRVVAGPRVVLGRQAFEERLRRLFVGYRARLAGEWGRIEVVDLRYGNGLAVQSRGGVTETEAPPAG
jgi:cell division protein FtsQ